jgi:hypothetical protein
VVREITADLVLLHIQFLTIGQAPVVVEQAVQVETDRLAVLRALVVLVLRIQLVDLHLIMLVVAGQVDGLVHLQHSHHRVHFIRHQAVLVLAVLVAVLLVLAGMEPQIEGEAEEERLVFLELTQDQAALAALALSSLKCLTT